MRIHVEYPRQLHTHYRADDREFALLNDDGHEIDRMHIDKVRDYLATHSPMQLAPVDHTAFTLTIGALERQLACVVTRTDASDMIEIDGRQLLLNGRPVATLPGTVRSVTFMPIRMQYLRDAPERFVAILGRGGAWLFDMHTHSVIASEMSAEAASERHAAGGVA